jgi:hypothetical protein
MAVPLAQLNEEQCPVTEKLFGQLHQASPTDAVGVAKSLPEQQRAQLVMFCYNKSHLHALGLMIASTCNRNTLVTAGGPLGDTIYRQSRDPDKTLSEELQSSGSQSPKPISLAGPNNLRALRDEF